ncbi:toxin-antitoxin system YwqK family antitoxin [Cytophagaceae bacterium ABcell3]|nr:toxin-antitoxin system YwqK family antitoxin [Cytophagaceae bacterium ABcell3]
MAGYKFYIPFCFFLMVSIGAYTQNHKKVETFYDHKKQLLKEEYYVLAKSPNVTDSLYTSFYQNGKVKSRGHYKKNKPEGLWEYFYENGNPRMTTEIKDRQNHGACVYYYENGNVQAKGNMEKGLREGEWEYFYENGALKNVGSFEKDKKTGIWIYYREDGMQKAQAEYEKDKGIYKEYFESGKLKSKGPIVNGKSNGLWKYYYESGGVKGEGYEKDGLKEGMWKFYYPNGTLSSEGTYDAGNLQGEWKYFHENGTLSAEGEQKDGSRHGYWKLYYDNGAFKGEGNFDRGEGPYKEYYESGKLKIKGFIKNERNEGQWKYYYETGELEGRCHFTGGRGHYTGYYENGNLKMEGIIDNGVRTGIWKLYKEEGGISGYYRTYYDKENLVFREVPTVADTLRADSIIAYEKPKIVIPKKKSRYYTKTINEYKGYIIGFNPIAIILNELPVYGEYYIQERIGFELGLTYHRRPILGSISNAPLNQFTSTGFSAHFRHKLYQPDGEYGMLYYGHEVRFSYMEYGRAIVDTTHGGYEHINNLNARETLYEYSFIVGNRLMQDYRKDGFTIDVFAGIGIGYRHLSRNYPQEDLYTNSMNRVRSSRITIPIRLGLSVGYSF